MELLCLYPIRGTLTITSGQPLMELLSDLTDWLLA